MSAERLPLIGRDRVLVENLAKALHHTARALGDYTELYEDPRGDHFFVRLGEGRHVVKVTVELDRFEQDAE